MNENIINQKQQTNVFRVSDTGVMLVSATPITRQAYNDFRGWQLPADENGSDEGYLVECSDVAGGFVTWIPKGIEVTYNSIFGLTFGFALEALKQGCKVARTGWNGKGQYIVLVKPGYYDVGCSLVDKPGTLQPFLALKNAQDMFQPGWVPSQGDLFAEDWYVVLDSEA